MSVLLTLILAGCAVQEISLDSNFEYGKNSSISDLGCQFVISKITDDRNDPDSLGRLGTALVNSDTSVMTGNAAADLGTSLTSLALMASTPETEVSDEGTDETSSTTLEWLRNGLLSAGYRQTPAADGKTPVTLGITLKMAYIKNSRSAKASNVVMEVSFGDDPKTHVIRGSHSAINWADSRSEIQSSFNKALESAITHLNDLASTRCGSG